MLKTIGMLASQAKPLATRLGARAWGSCTSVVVRGGMSLAARRAGAAAAMGSARRASAISSSSPLRPAPSSSIAAETEAALASVSDHSSSSSSSSSGGVLEPQLIWPGRSHGCGELRPAQAGQRVTVCGWVDRYRNLGGILFLDIRDHTGIVQARPGGGACPCLMDCVQLPCPAG